MPELRVAAPQGADRARMWRNLNNYDLIILSYTAARLSRDAIKPLRFSYLILDEAQHIKNPGSGNARNCKGIAAAHRIVLSGTPLENSPEDLWSVMDFLQPGMLGTLPAFRREYGDLAGRPEAQRDLGFRVSPFIKRRTKAEVAKDLPSRSELTLYCEFDDAQRRLYDEVLADGRKALEATDGTHDGAAIFTRCCDCARYAVTRPAARPRRDGCVGQDGTVARTAQGRSTATQVLVQQFTYCSTGCPR